MDQVIPLLRGENLASSLRLVGSAHKLWLRHPQSPILLFA